MKRLIAALVVLLALVAVPARAAEWYVEGDPDDVNGVGSSADPFHSLTSAIAAASAGDTIYIKGVIREDVITISKSLNFKKWQGFANNALVTGNSTSVEDPGITTGSVLWRGMTPTWAATTWTNVGAATDGAGGRYFSITINNLSSVSIASVTVDWERNIDIYGRRYGHLLLVANAAAVASTDGSYYIDTTPNPDVLYVNPYGRVDATATPASNIPDMTYKVVRLVRHNEGMSATAVDNISFERIDFGPFCEPTATNTAGSAAWCLLFVGSSNVHLDHCNFWDGGYHCVGWTTSTNGDVEENLLVENCLASGLATAAGTVFVTHSGGTGGIVRNAVYRNCTALVHGLLSENLVDLTPVATQLMGFYSHGATNSIQGLTYENCFVRGFSDTTVNVRAWGCDSSPAATDSKSFKTYPIKLIDCEAIGAASAVTTTNAAAIKRCRFNTEDYALDNALGENASTCSGFWVQGASAQFYAESSVLITNTGQSGTDNRVIGWQGDCMMVNCAIIDYNTIATLARYDVFLREESNSDVLDLRQNIFARYNKTTGLEMRPGLTGSSVNQTSAIYLSPNASDVYINNVIIGCLQMQKNDGFNAAYDTFAEWKATYDTSLIVDTNYFPPLDIDPNTSDPSYFLKLYLFELQTGRQSPGSWFDKYRNVRTTYQPEMGINGRKYNGNIGPYQWGDVVLTGPLSPIRNRSRP